MNLAQINSKALFFLLSLLGLIFLELMKRFYILYIVTFVILFSSVYSQNLVPNGSFEIFTQCPANGDKIYYATEWFQPTKYPGGYNINQSSSTDYYNSCAGNSPYTSIPKNFWGYQNTANGNAYIGMVYFHIAGNYREYAEVKLTENLVAGRKYHLNYYISLIDGSKYATNQFDAYFSQDSLIDTSWHERINLVPQVINTNQTIVSDTMNWTQISESYIAVGGENFLTLGNFHHQTLTDTIHVNPSIQSDYFAYYYIDNVSLVEDSSTGINVFENTDFEVFPNPASKDINISSKQIIEEVNLMDIRSKSVLQLKFLKENATIDLSQLDGGIYIVKCKFMNGEVVYKKIVVQH